MTATASIVAVEQGPKGVVTYYMRPNGRSPANEFLERVPAHLLTRLLRQFKQFAELGYSSASSDNFKPLNGEAKGLWSFKAHDQRLFCARAPDRAGKEVVVLLDGWVKDRDTHVEERNVYRRVLELWSECRASVDFNVISTADQKPQKKVQVPELVDTPPETPEVEKPKKIPSRSELLEMATLVVDGKEEGLEFLTLVEEYRNHRTAVETEVARLREEAARLAAVEAELARLEG